jgi:phage/plasmid-associated DNA primase
MFDDWLVRMWDGDSDSSEKIKVFKQLMGACLCPHFPTIAIFVGAPNRGKSTLVKFLVTLVDQANTSSVQLNDMHGFNMDSMIGKLVNYCTEMETNKPINDVVVKSLIDRKPFTVQRKFKTDAVAYLPAVFLGAANDSPASLDGKSQAYGRRLIFIKTESLKLLPGTEYDFERELWEKEKEGIVWKAVAGLRELLESGGKFTVPKSSMAEVRDFEEKSDVVAQFIESGENGDWADENSRLVRGVTKSIKFMDLFRHFSSWQEKAVPSGNQRIGQKEFGRRMALRGFRRNLSREDKAVEGIGIESFAVKSSRTDSVASAEIC